VLIADAHLPGMGPTVPTGGSTTAPYYESDRVRLYLADAREVIPTLPADSVDLLVTDPPYGVGWNSGKHKVDPFGPMAGDDGALDVIGLLGAATRVLRHNRHVYVFGYSPDQLAGPLNLGGTAELVWDKEQPGLGNLSHTWAPSYERITWGMVTSGTSERAQNGQLSARIRRGSVLRATRKNGQAVTRHPTEKPVDLMRLLVESSTMPGETVLDPFAGSGSTLVAAIITGRKAIGVEISPQFAQTAAARCRRAEAVADQITGL
jgi:site-specific DNA-methyltransferase (adenine-specific)